MATKSISQSAIKYIAICNILQRKSDRSIRASFDQSGNSKKSIPKQNSMVYPSAFPLTTGLPIGSAKGEVRFFRVSALPTVSVDDRRRVEALIGLDILDTPEEQEFDELVRLASEICDTPISLVSLVDKDRQWFKAAVGLEVKETPRNVSFCTHAIDEQEIFIVENAVDDARFRDSSLVTGDPNIRFYAGVPIHAPNGYAVGTLCVIDIKPRILTESQKDALTILGRQVKARMELRQKQKSLEQAISTNEHLMSAIRDRNNLFSAFMNHGPFVGFIKDADGRMVYYNDQMSRHFGVQSNTWIGLNDHQIWPAEAADRIREDDLSVLTNDSPIEISEEVPDPNGIVTHWKTYKFPFRQENGDLMLAGMSIDVTREFEKEQALFQANQLLEQMATTDALTGLRNRRAFEDRISSEFSAAARSGRPLTLICMDVDNFKRRNDTYGHAAGDDALRRIGRILVEQIRHEDIAARIGGEEFAILMPGEGLEGALLLSERIQGCLRSEDCGPRPLTVSVGISTVIPSVQNWEQLISRADDAMYEAKRTGKDRITLASESTDSSRPTLAQQA
jgi:diguanylate cyclase (GGDEF)-like protein/PAS domain S-box-containing protein